MKQNINKSFLNAKKQQSTELKENHFDALTSGDLNAIARSLSLLESTSKKHENNKRKLLDWIYSRPTAISKRIGITGSPGVGKSSFIEAIGQLLCDRGYRIAVLSIDPSSAVSGGSILGDQTRMTELSKRKNAYIRPSPSNNILGGVAGATRESIALFESLNYDYILIETVGVGQSETAIAQMTDLFLLLLLPGAGDSLQGIKRGIVEMADIIAVNKSDKERIQLAAETRRAYKQAIQLFPPKKSGWDTAIHSISALEQTGLEEILSEIDSFFRFISDNDYLRNNRSDQAIQWFDTSLNRAVLQWTTQSPGLKKYIDQQKSSVVANRKAPYIAAQEVIQWLNNQKV